MTPKDDKVPADNEDEYVIDWVLFLEQIAPLERNSRE